jgi:DNA ligase (NAD+)
MNIEGLGEALIDQLVTTGLVRDFADLYRLETAQVAALDRMGNKSATKLETEIARSKDLDLWRLLHGLGIRHVGEGGARALARAFRSMARLRRASIEELRTIPDIGEVVARAVRSFFDETPNTRLIDDLAAAGVRMEDPEPPGTEPAPARLAGRTYVITGSLEAMSREAAAAEIQRLGGKVSSAVSRKTTGVVVGRDPGSKVDRARALGVPELTERDFLTLIMKQ